MIPPPIPEPVGSSVSHWQGWWTSLMRVSAWGRLSAQNLRAEPIDAGQIILHGDPVKIRSPVTPFVSGSGSCPKNANNKPFSCEWPSGRISRCRC